MSLTEREELVWRETVEAESWRSVYEQPQAAPKPGAYSGPWWIVARLQMILIGAVGVLIVCELLARH